MSQQKKRYMSVASLNTLDVTVTLQEERKRRMVANVKETGMRKRIDPLIRNALHALDNDDKIDALELLLNEGPKSFIEIMKDMDKKQTQVNRILISLIQGGLIKHSINLNDVIKKKRHSYYEATRLADDLVSKNASLLEEPVRPVFWMANISDTFQPGSDLPTSAFPVAGLARVTAEAWGMELMEPGWNPSGRIRIISDVEVAGI